MGDIVVALQMENPAVVSKVERLAKRMGLSQTAVVERAVDRLLGETAGPSAESAPARLAALLAQLDRIPDRADASDALQWDEPGLPRCSSQIPLRSWRACKPNPNARPSCRPSSVPGAR